MPKVYFYRGSNPSKIEGALTFDPNLKKIYLGTGDDVDAFDGCVTAGCGNVSNMKLYLIGTSKQSPVGTPEYTYSQSTAFIGSDGCVYSGGYKTIVYKASVSNTITLTGHGDDGETVTITGKCYLPYGCIPLTPITTTVAAPTFTSAEITGLAMSTTGENSGRIYANVKVSRKAFPSGPQTDEGYMVSGDAMVTFAGTFAAYI